MAKKEVSTPANETVSEIKAAGGRAVADPSDIATVAGGEALVEHAIVWISAISTFWSISPASCATV